MKAIINGKRYDTETAEELATLPCSKYKGDFGWHWTTVHRTKRGAFFLHGIGGPMTMWAKSAGSNGYVGGEGIRPVTDDEAREYLEQCGCAGMRAIEKYLPVEDA